MQTQSVFASATRRKIIAAAAIVFFLLGLAADGLYCYKKSIADLDALAYASIADGGGSTFPAEARECFVQMPSAHCEAATSTFMYRDVATYSPADFATFQRFYRVKPMYCLLLTALRRKLGLGAFTALRLLAVACYAAIGIVLWVWLHEHLSIAATSLAALCLMNSPAVLYLGKSLAPDGLSTFLLLLAAYLLLYKKTLWPGAVALALLPAAHPDNIIFVALFAGALIYRAQSSPQRRWGLLALLAAGCVLMSETLVLTTHALPWEVLFKRSFLAWIAPASFAGTHITLRQYLHVLSSNGVRVIVFCLPVAVFFAALALANPRSWQPLRLLVLASTATVAIKLALFPGVEPRYYVWFYLVAAIAACAVVAEAADSRPSWFTEGAGARRLHSRGPVTTGPVV